MKSGIYHSRLHGFWRVSDDESAWLRRHAHNRQKHDPALSRTLVRAKHTGIAAGSDTDLFPEPCALSQTTLIVVRRRNTKSLNLHLAKVLPRRLLLCLRFQLATIINLLG